MVIDYLSIGQRIKAARKEKNFSQERLAEHLDVTAVYVSRIENGKTKLSLELLVKISIFLEFSPGYFLSGNILYPNENISHELVQLLENCSSQKMRMIMDIIKVITKY